MRRPTSAAGAARRTDDGQAAVEFALVLPILAVVLLAVLQIGVVVRNDLVLHHAAREGARAAAVSADPGRAARSAVERAVDLPVSVRVSSSSRTVTVTVVYVDPTDVALVGPVIGAVTLTATATMVLEPP